MFGLHFSYIFSLLGRTLFGISFFTVDLYLPKIRNLKSAKLYQQSKIYLDETIDNAGGLLDEGVRRGRIAYLLNPNNEETLYNYVRLQFRTDPAQALLKWQDEKDARGTAYKRVTRFANRSARRPCFR